QGGADVVEVGGGDVAAAFVEEAVEQATAAEGVGEVPVPGGVLARVAVFVDEQAAVGLEPQRHHLREGGDVVAVETVSQGLADGGVGGVARHQPEGDSAADLLF